MSKVHNIPCEECKMGIVKIVVSRVARGVEVKIDRCTVCNHQLQVEELLPIKCERNETSTHRP